MAISSGDSFGWLSALGIVFVGYQLWCCIRIFMCDVMAATLTIFLSSIPLSQTNILNFMYYIYFIVYIYCIWKSSFPLHTFLILFCYIFWGGTKVKTTTSKRSHLLIYNSRESWHCMINRNGCDTKASVPTHLWPRAF